MAGTISFGGIGSGMDVEGIVNGLVQASSGTLSGLKSRAAATQAAVSTLGEVSSLLSKLASATGALKDPRNVASYSATASSDALTVTANGAALPGSFDVVVEQLARAHRGYSDAFASKSDALGQEGSLTIQLGDESNEVEVEASDSLEDVARKINALGLKVSATTFYDGSQYRLQINGLDTGAANAVTITETGTTLGLDDPANVAQQARDARISIDGHVVTSATNTITGTMQGVTLVLKKESADPVTVEVSSDPNALKTKLQSVVDAYNAVVRKIHETAGFGTQKASNPVLAGDATLRTIGNTLTNGLLTAVSSSGRFQTAGSIGLSFNNDGTLKLDDTKLKQALETDPAGVTRVIAGDDDNPGVMDILQDLADGLVRRGDGIVNLRKSALEQRVKSLNDQVTREQERLDKYADALRKQFQSADAAISANQSLLTYLWSL